MRKKYADQNTGQHQPLDVSVKTQNPSFVSQKSKEQKQSYLDFISKFDKNIDYQKNNSAQIQSSLSQMRIVLKQFNLMLNKMMDKNYQYLAQKQPTQLSFEKQIQILQAQIQSAKKLITNQDIQITTLNNITYSMEGKQQSYEQKLIDQIMIVKDKMPSVSLQSKHSACDINRNGYVLVNQEQDNSLYFKVNILRSDIQRAYQRLRRLQQKQKSISEKQRELQEKNYQIGQKFSKCVETARQQSMQITVNGSIISLKQKYINLQKRRDQQLKKNALIEHVSRNNQGNIQKKINDMKKLMSQYNLKQRQLQKNLLQIENETELVLKKSNITQKLAQKSFSFRYAETLLKGQKQKNNLQRLNDQNQYEDDFQDFLGNKNSPKNKGLKEITKDREQLSIPIKPSLNLIRKKNQYGQNKYEKSVSMVQIPLKKNKQQKDSFFQDKQTQNRSKAFNIRRSSANQLQKQNKKQVNNSIIKSPESPQLKLWKQTEQQKQNEKKAEKQYKISKPNMNLKKRTHNLTVIENKGNKNLQEEQINYVEQINIQPKFSRLSQKKSPKITDQYMDYLQQKGRKILGLH